MPAALSEPSKKKNERFEDNTAGENHLAQQFKRLNCCTVRTEQRNARFKDNTVVNGQDEAVALVNARGHVVRPEICVLVGNRRFCEIDTAKLAQTMHNVRIKVIVSSPKHGANIVSGLNKRSEFVLPVTFRER